MNEADIIRQLLRPRYRCTGNIPWVNSIKKGDVLQFQDAVGENGSLLGVYYRLEEKETWIDTMFLDEFPHLFKRLFWYEDRPVDIPMPGYVRITDDYPKKGSVIYRVDEWKKEAWANALKPIEYDHEEKTKDFLSIKWYFGKERSEPASEAEYIQYQQSLLTPEPKTEPVANAGHVYGSYKFRSNRNK